jgi:predicted transglutaminase-like protease
MAFNSAIHVMNRLAVKHIATAVNPAGKIYIIGQILDDSRLSPLEAVGFNLAFMRSSPCL